MILSSNRHLTTVNAGLIYLEALTVSVVVLAIITLVAGRYPHSLQHSPILTVGCNFRPKKHTVLTIPT
jgi:hypothetical protein